MSIGASVPRFEDARLVAGAGTYVGDLAVPGCLDAAFVRSTHAHGVLLAVRMQAARELPGVVGAFAAADLPDLPAVPAPMGAPTALARPWPALATDRVRYVGQTVAVVVAADRYRAEDGADAVAVEVEPLPAVVTPAEALAEDVVELFPGLANVVSDLRVGDPIEAEVWERAPVVVEARYRQSRLAPTSIEARAILARPEADGRLTVWSSHQAPHRLRNELAGALGLPPEHIRVIVNDVGGAFGGKSATFPEYVTVAYLALRMRRPVRWLEDRDEALTGATHGRGQDQRVRLAADDDGRMLALELEIDADVGGYPHTGEIVPGMSARMAAGAYRTPRVHARARCLVTTTTPTAPYRGAGRPEAAYAVERTVDLLARRLGIDPAELRRRNFIPPEAFPYETPTGRRYDSGAYEAALDVALDAVGYAGWRDEQARRRDAGSGPPLGIGICSYVERSGGEAALSKEFGSVEVCADGTFVAHSGSCSTGTGHETSFAQVVAAVLEVEVHRVRVVEGDTDAIAIGFGSMASRSMQIGGSALHGAARSLVEQARARMAERCGVPVDAAVYRRGAVSAGGESLTLAELAPLRATEVFESPQAFPFGCYVAVVEVDPRLGDVRILRLVAVDDAGVVVSPLIVHGQTFGSAAQGIGQALYELMPYDASGRPQAETLLDYLLPTLAEVPPLRVELTETPNPNAPLGAKGAGEAGCIGAPPAIVNAVADALDLDDPGLLQMPLTPEACWTAMRAATPVAS